MSYMYSKCTWHTLRHTSLIMCIGLHRVTDSKLIKREVKWLAWCQKPGPKIYRSINREKDSVCSGCSFPKTVGQLWTWQYLPSQEADAKRGINITLYRSSIINIVYRYGSLHYKRFTWYPQIPQSGDEVTGMQTSGLPATVFWALWHLPPSVTKNVNGILIMFPFFLHYKKFSGVDCHCKIITLPIVNHYYIDI